ncbi:MAG TPA: ribosomal protein S18-alanine N-acetyltransferase [Reyranella sp.]|nr:ribosomal protein S18-alanine N-acetyltransferase [Reyranella sp.]HTE81533.1 ribosomal protein S18-alanine N-acetyltransferase [Reyranella sp.]
MRDRFVFRSVGAPDLDRAAALHRQAFEPLGERPWTRRDMAELLASPGVAGLFVEVEGREDGFALWRTVADEAELLTIAVQSDRRRHGLGRALLAAVVGQARRGGAQCLFLEVGADNAPARSLYSQAGFVEVGRRPDYYRRRTGFADALVLRLTLIAGG